MDKVCDGGKKYKDTLFFFFLFCLLGGRNRGEEQDRSLTIQKMDKRRESER